jgi:hypothetical protein
MRFVLLISVAILTFSCSNKEDSAASICDTACNNSTISFSDTTSEFEPSLSITRKNCVADTLTWKYKGMDARRQIQLGGYFDQSIQTQQSAVDCYFNDSSYIWLTFNDCKTGRGYALKLPFDKAQSIKKISSALTRFDPKYAVHEKLRAYAEASGIHVVNVETGAEEFMSFEKEYEVDWNDVHSTIDSINVQPDRIFVRLKDGGSDKDIEKKISL